MDRPSVAVVLAGGTGTRLYPASRADRPKQFLALGGDRSLLVRAVERARVADRRVALTSPRHADRTREHLQEAGFAVREWGDDGGAAEGDGSDGNDARDPESHDPPVEVLVEPEPKDTGPALVYAAARIRADADGSAAEPVLLCLPSDHSVDGDFESVARHALRVAAETRGLVTVGIEPTRPATGYGYIEPWREEDGYAPVRSFHEKPDRERARELIDAGCLWNAGTFAWTPSALLRAAVGTRLEPLVEAAGGPADEDERGSGNTHEGERPAGLDAALRSAYAAVDPVSVDYAVLERTDDAFVVEAPGIRWDDLGTWDALGRVLDPEDGNAVLGEALALDAEDNVIATEDAHVTAIGVEGLVVAAYDDRVLVVPAEEAGRVREAVDLLRDRDLF
ncbi:mannose-1-phosphate guanyltransferase [Halobacteriales archaeon QS_8_69_26]|nr:MAG: mannose-1-phosphate guanyltransferase [Halobacteriales archaeon QS_8_69_26]